MLKRHSFYTVALFSVVLMMTAGCASQNAVKKDESPVLAPTAKQIDQSATNRTPSQQIAVDTASPIIPVKASVTDQQSQNSASRSQQLTTLEKIYFDFDSANLSDAARSTLTKNAALLQQQSSTKLRIEGNCDDRGSAEYNLALGERRAKSAQQYLMTLGIQPDRLTTISYGKEKPAAQGSDEAAMTKNRRDEFVVTSK